jgi:hypothetical protein
MGTRDKGRDSPFGSQRLLPVKNDEASAIPMGGICWLNGETTVGDETVYLAQQADGSDHPWFIALSAIGPGERGLVSCDWPAQAAYDTSAATPAVGDEIGPISGNWRMRPTGEGFTAITAGDGGWVTVTGMGVAGPPGTAGTMQWVLVSLPSALTQAQASKAACPVIDAFGDGTLAAGTITVENPPTSTGGVYMFAIASGAYAQVIGNGTRYVFVMPQLVTQTVVENVDWTSPDLTQDTKDIQVLSSGNPQTDTILTGTTDCPEP